MSDIATAVNLGTIGVHYVEEELTPQAAAEVERLGYTALWIAGTRAARLTARPGRAVGGGAQGGPR